MLIRLYGVWLDESEKAKWDACQTCPLPLMQFVEVYAAVA